METRYVRNCPTLTEEQQAVLGEKHILLAGCGGLGGPLLELLLRAGVGAVTAVDGDCFDETNLNRQVLCTTETLGRRKVLCAQERAALLRPDVRFRAVDAVLNAENAPDLLRGCDLALDALDSVEARLVLADACAAAGIPLVHGAVSGLSMQAAVIPPGSGLLRRIYAGSTSGPAGSVLAPICAFCAAVQAAEAIRLLVGKPAELAGKLLWADLERMEFQTLEL